MIQVATEGALTLLPHPETSRPLFQFWRRHRGLLDEAKCLRTQFETVPALCERLLAYLSTDLHWVSQSGTQPVAFEALAAGLSSYRDARCREFDQRPFSLSRAPFRAFVESALDVAAARLSMVRLTGLDAMWSPASGLPLQPWLDQHPTRITVHCLNFDEMHAE
ncbi:MAG: hypothetical protein ACR2RE_22450, partial [Geminicoccaceae bacterium]